MSSPALAQFISSLRLGGLTFHFRKVNLWQQRFKVIVFLSYFKQNDAFDLDLLRIFIADFLLFLHARLEGRQEKFAFGSR